jgi:hypothetical protein
LAPFLQPVQFSGFTMTLADVQGFSYLRTQTPEYLRLVQQGSLRTFLGETLYVSLVFGATVSIAGYWVRPVHRTDARHLAHRQIPQEGLGATTWATPRTQEITAWLCWPTWVASLNC